MNGDRGPRKYRIVALGGLLGVALLIFIGVRSRATEVLTILSTGGGWALLAASLYRIVPVELNAAAWGALLEKRRLGWAATLRLRWIGEAVNSLLPAAQVGGDFARARLLTAGGVPASEATAAMVADVAIGAFTQVLFTFLGAAALILGAAAAASARRHLGWLALVIGAGAGFAALLIVVARVGVGRLLTALPLHLNDRLAARLRTGGAAIDRSRRARSGVGPARCWRQRHLAPRRLAGPDLRNVAGPSLARAADRLGGGAGHREPGRVGAGRGVRGPGRHRRAGGGAGGRGRPSA